MAKAIFEGIKIPNKGLRVNVPFDIHLSQATCTESSHLLKQNKKRNSVFIKSYNHEGNEVSTTIDLVLVEY